MSLNDPVDAGFLLMEDADDPPSSHMGPMRRENPCIVWVDAVSDITYYSAYAVQFAETGQAANFFIELWQGVNKLCCATGNAPPNNPCDCGSVANGGGLHVAFSLDTWP